MKEQGRDRWSRKMLRSFTDERACAHYRRSGAVIAFDAITMRRHGALTPATACCFASADIRPLATGTTALLTSTTTAEHVAIAATQLSIDYWAVVASRARVRCRRCSLPRSLLLLSNNNAGDDSGNDDYDNMKTNSTSSAAVIRLKVNVSFVIQRDNANPNNCIYFTVLCLLVCVVAIGYLVWRYYCHDDRVVGCPIIFVTHQLHLEKCLIFIRCARAQFMLTLSVNQLVNGD